MSSAPSQLPWAPPGLPPAVARAQPAGRSVIKGAVGLVAFGVVFGLIRGVRPGDVPFALAMLAFVVAVAAYMAVRAARTEVVAGPGWLSVRGVFRRQWTRTDQLRSVKVHRSGFERVLEMRDGEGRKVDVIWSDLRLDDAIVRQVARDVRTSLAAGAEMPAEARQILVEGG